MIPSLRKLFSSDSDAQGYSITGRKNTQEDAFYISPQRPHGRLVLVADGVGGHAHGEYASNLCVERYRTSFEHPHARIADIPAYLRQKAIMIASEVWETSQHNPEYHHCGTTLSAFLVKDDSYYILHIGDSRVYMFDRSDNLQQLTRDQTLVQKLIEQGTISPEEAKTHPQKNVMYSAIGQEPAKVQMDIRGPEPIRSGELLLAFSDGIHDALSDEEIGSILTEHKKNENMAEILVQAAFDAGGKDNITACWYRH